MKAGQSVGELGARAQDMGSVRSGARRETRIVFEQSRDVARRGDLDQALGDSLGVALGARRDAHQRAGDVAGRQRFGEAGRESVQLGDAQRRRDQEEAAGGGGDHGALADLD